MDNYSHSAVLRKLEEIGYTENEASIILEETAKTHRPVSLLHRYQIQWTGVVYRITREGR